MRASVLTLIASFVLFFFAARTARADLKVDGKWKQGALREDFTVQNWLDASCGPPPQSSSSGGGEAIQLRLEGDELAFVGGGRVYRTNQCYDPMPSLTRESHSRASDGKTWRTRCTTPANDPRKTILNTLVVASSDSHIDLVETGRYEIQLENGRCMADVKRTRSFDLLGDAPAATTTPPATTPAPAATPEPPKATCASPGAPQKLEVRPSKKLLRSGESFAFRGLVLDANGCQTRTGTTFRLATGTAVNRGVTIDAKGLVKVDPSAAEGIVEIVATAAGKDARVTVEIVSPARYDELLAASGLNAEGENEEAATAVIATQSLGAGEGRVEDRARQRRIVFLAIVGGVLVVLAAVAIALGRRAARAKKLMARAEERHEARVQEVLGRNAKREAEHAAQMRAHEESVKAAAAASAAASSAPAVPKKRGKICPTCGERFDDAQATFCGKDGTALVLLN